MNLDELRFFAEALGLFLILPCTLLGGILLLRKDCSPSAIMLAIGGVLAVAFAFIADAFCYWITDGSLGIGDRNPRWELHQAAESVLDALKLTSAMTAAIGFALFANRMPPARNQWAEHAEEADAGNT